MDGMDDLCVNDFRFTVLINKANDAYLDVKALFHPPHLQAGDLSYGIFTPT